MNAIVTKQSLTEMLNAADNAKRARIIGRALVVLLARQTQQEQLANMTTDANNVGFTGSDARAGTLSAKSFIRNGTLQQWQVDNWMQPWRGAPRIAKYHRQLNEVAVEKARLTNQAI